MQVKFLIYVSTNVALLMFSLRGLAASYEERLAHSEEWLRILYYVPRWSGQRTGLVDTPNFYLSPVGKTDPEAELRSTLEAFRQPIRGAADEHALCRFPLRRQFLTRHAKLLSGDIPDIYCQAYQDWREAFPVTGASLVFSSNYLNNPSSMYGHTFIRLHRKANDARDASPLLDYAVNFAANPTTSNPVLYSVLGLFGGFYGTFSLVPYYLKVQEYNNSESRDLWEYPLNLTSEQLDALMATLWEVGPHGIRYYYFDENCSFILLATIAAANTRLTAVDQFPVVVSPKDTVTALIEQNGLSEPNLRLSALSRFVARRDLLSQEEREILQRQVRAATLTPEVLSLSHEKKIRVLDALSEWIAFKEKLAGDRGVKKYQGLWQEALTARANLGTPSPPLVIDKSSQRPEIGHNAQRVSISYQMPFLRKSAFDGQPNSDPAVIHAGYRFTLHDTLSPLQGYSADQEITMGDFQWMATRRSSWKVLPTKATIVSILSTPPYDALTGAVSWTLTLGSKRAVGPDDSTWMMHRVEAGFGGTLGATKNSKIYLIPTVMVGALKENTLHPDAALGYRAGLLIDPSRVWRYGIVGSYDAQKSFRQWQMQSFVSYDFAKQFETRFEILRESYRDASGRITLFSYF